MQSPATYITSFTVPTGATTGARVTIGPGGTIQGYYADGRLAWSETSGNSAAITAYSDSPANSLISVALQNGGIVYTAGPGITVPELFFKNGVNEMDLQVTTNGNMALTTATGTTGWVQPTPAGNWSLGGLSVNDLGLQYRIDNQDNLVIVGALTNSGIIAGGSNSTMFTLDATHRVTAGHNTNVYALHTNAAGAVQLTPFRINIASSGVVTFVNGATATVAGDFFYLNIVIPLGNIV